MNLFLIFPGFIIAFIIVLYYERKIRNISVKLKNKVHFYVARNKDGSLWLYIGEPIRDSNINMFKCDLSISCICLTHTQLWRFGLNEKDYVNLKWEDEPLEVFVNMEY